MTNHTADTTPLTLEQWQALPAAARVERRRLGVVGAAPVVNHPITPEEREAARIRCGGRPYYTLVERGEETDLLCAVCHSPYWRCQHVEEISLAYDADREAGTVPSPLGTTDEEEPSG